MTAQERAAARERCDAATAGPWFGSHDQRVLTGEGVEVIAAPYDGGLDATEEDFSFTVHARTDLPAALDEIDRLEAILRRHGIDPTTGEHRLDRLAEEVREDEGRLKRLLQARREQRDKQGDAEGQT
jgi:hypothetical protein